MPEGQRREIEVVAERFGINASEERWRNGDKIALAVLDRMIVLEQRFGVVERKIETVERTLRRFIFKETRLCRAHVAALAGIAFSTWSFVFPAVERAASFLGCMIPGDAVCWAPGSVEVHWPVEFTQLAGGILIFFAVIFFFKPELADKLVGRILKGK